jgi:HD-like signal output (HDOD) protein
MKIQCPSCPKTLIFPDDRLPKDKPIVFPCPDCKGKITVDLRAETAVDGDPVSERRSHSHLSGDALKKKILATVQDLPPMPQTVFKAREIMADPKAGFDALATLIESDQAIAAKVLKLANSSYYAMRGEISSIQRALVVLGNTTLGELITLGGVSGLLGNRLEGYGLDVGDLWKHSLAVAFGSRFIAEKVAPALANDAFTSGLLHDSGKLILDSYILERWQDFEDVMADGEHSFLDAEKQVLALDHPEIASEVCTAWHIPLPLTQAIRYHHQPSQSQDNQLAYIVHIADATALMSGVGNGVDGTMYQIEDNALSFLKLQEEILGEVMSHMLTATKKITEKA